MTGNVGDSLLGSFPGGLWVLLAPVGAVLGDVGTAECALSCHSATTPCPCRGPGGVPSEGQGSVLLPLGWVPQQGCGGSVPSQLNYSA